MNLHILIHSIIFLIISALAADDGQSMRLTTLPNCPSMCGDVSIPYPFGIGKEFYHDEWYEIICNNNTNKPFLSKFNMEVREVGFYEPTITVMTPVASNCGGLQKGNTIWSGTNFIGSPYNFSSYANEFVVVGCDPALLFYPDYDDGEMKNAPGCLSSCKLNASNEGCHGINCCKNSISSNYMETGIPFYRISIEENTTIVCTYAFLGKNDMNESYYWTLSSINSTKQVPVVLTWELENLDTNNYCEHLDGSVYYCRCPDDHTGNPYLPNGCKIVKACAKCKRHCHRTITTEDREDFRCKHTIEIIQGRGLNCLQYFQLDVQVPYFYHHLPLYQVLLLLLFLHSGGGLFLILLSGFCFRVYKLIKKTRIAKLKKKFFKRNGGLLLQQQISSVEGMANRTILFTADELLKATDNYNENRILGQGGQGTVYKGMLTDGRIAAVKKSKLIDESQLEQFINEVVILSQMKHRNIVQLLGCCLETDVPLLVYEFVVNGNLFDLIHNKNEGLPLSWKMRLQIVTEVARGLAYLHSAASIPIYHRDIKSTNILLDKKFRAKISDFGTSRSIAIEQTHLTTLVYGTLGYLDPEYFQSSQFTDKSDVYSFGVVLVELLTGQKPISSLNELEDERSLAVRFISCAEQMLFNIIDTRILEEAPKEEIIAVSHIARRCLNLNGKKRPTMKEVATNLEVLSRTTPSTLVPISFEQGTLSTEKNKNRLDYSTSTIINSDYRAFSSSHMDPLVFHTE